MPEITNDDLQAIQDGFLEAAFRANRLHEWTLFDVQLQNLDRRFTDFHTAVKTAIVQNSMAALPEIMDIWDRCSTIERIDLQTFLDGVEWINKSTWEVLNGGPPKPNAVVMRTLNIADIQQQASELDTRLAMQAVVPLVEPCNLFRKTLNAHRAARQQTVTKEVMELCNLTGRLRERIQKK